MLDPKDEIKQRLDVVEIISEYLPLKPAGSSGFKACCPFHGEKTPSFHVSREKQIWHCFGCNKGGDLFAFVMDLEGMNFPSVLELMAGKAGVKLPERTQSQASKESKKERDVLLDLHIIAQKFYTKILTEHEYGADARKYLKDRGITDDLIEKFGLGFASDQWSMMANYLQKRDYDDELIIKSGLAKKKLSGDGIIDRFRNRILVPLHDARGRVIGFTGRSLVETDKSGPKYLNSPETDIYNKRAVLYGLHLAKTAIRQNKSVIIVEGNLDVIASHKAGVENIVASSGTALTDIQLQTLKKLTNHLIFCFDSDNAGFEAARRGIRLAQQMDFDVHVILIPDEMGKDPDDVVQNDPEKWVQIASKPIHIIKYYFNRIFAKSDISNITQKKEATKFMLSEIAQYTDAVEREHWLMQLSDRTMIGIDVLRSEIKKHAQTQKTPEAKAPIKPSEQKKTRNDSVVSFLLGVLLVHPQYFDDISNNLSQETIKSDQLRVVYKDIKSAYTQANTPSTTQKTTFSILSALYKQEQRTDDANCINALTLKTEQILDGFQEKQVREEIDRHLEILVQAPRKAHLLELESNIRQAEMAGDKQRARQLTDEYLEVLKS
ncbi:DNA primase [Candidatus Uhrbacteria bacterium]|jgi:DNA primase|nr:DNA primase [Candidatus Uhrbacteria bacterium]MBT7717312.1 DNA primase [Candidatus Uhrbacteria bacterium]